MENKLKLKLTVLCPAMADFNLSMMRAMSMRPNNNEEAELQYKAFENAKAKLEEIVGEFVDVRN